MPVTYQENPKKKKTRKTYKHTKNKMSDPTVPSLVFSCVLQFFLISLVLQFCFFPTCHVRVIRFYNCCLLSSSSSSFLSASSSSLPSSSPSPSPTVCCNGQRRISTANCRSQWAPPDLNREGQIAMGSTGPQDLNPGAPERSGQCRASTGELPSGVGSTGPQLPEKNRKYVRKESRKICQKICQKNDVRKYAKKECQKICQKKNVRNRKECQKICQ